MDTANLAKRQYNFALDWEIQAGQALSPNAIAGHTVDDYIARQEMKNNPNVLDCLQVDAPDPDTEDVDWCCGCLCTRCVYGFSDIDPCDPGACDEDDADGISAWPGVTIPTSRKRDATNSSDDSRGTFFRSEDWVNGVANAYGGDAVAEKTEPLYVLRSRPETLEQSLAKYNPNDHALVERVTGYSVGVGPKAAKFCNQRIRASYPYEYPSFPKDVSQAWDTADGGMWSNIRAYFGNASASCSDWSVAQIWPADTVLSGTTPIRADYESKS